MQTITIHCPDGAYTVCADLGPDFGQVVNVKSEEDDEGNTCLPSVDWFNLHAYIAAHGTLDTYLDAEDFEALDLAGNHVSFDQKPRYLAS